MPYSSETSHISDMQRRRYLLVTTLRNIVACVVLIAPVGTSHAFGMPLNNYHIN